VWADLLIVSSPQQQADAYDAVVAAVESGEMPRSQVQESVERVLRVKEKYDLGVAGRH
jgi:beta-N-acetylhexosaminidase